MKSPSFDPPDRCPGGPRPARGRLGRHAHGHALPTWRGCGFRRSPSSCSASWPAPGSSSGSGTLRQDFPRLPRLSYARALGRRHALGPALRPGPDDDLRGQGVDDPRRLEARRLHLQARRGQAGRRRSIGTRPNVAGHSIGSGSPSGPMPGVMTAASRPTTPGPRSPRRSGGSRTPRASATAIVVDRLRIGAMPPWPTSRASSGPSGSCCGPTAGSMSWARTTPASSRLGSGAHETLLRLGPAGRRGLLLPRLRRAGRAARLRVRPRLRLGDVPGSGPAPGPGRSRWSGYGCRLPGLSPWLARISSSAGSPARCRRGPRRTIRHPAAGGPAGPSPWSARSC